MTASRSTVLRLERSITAEYGSALATAQQAYADLAETVLRAARERGFAGSDLHAALHCLIQPGSDDDQIGQLAIELWSSFFANFRQDELQHEAASFQQRAAHLDAHTYEKPPKEAPLNQR